MVTLTYIDPSGERLRPPSIRVFRRANTRCPMLTLDANFEVSNCCTLLSSSFLSMGRALASTVHAVVWLPYPTQILPASDSELRPYVCLGEQLLLSLYWAITTNKSQGQTIKKTVIYLGKSEATGRLTFGCSGRAKRLVDLLVVPMPLTGFPSLATNLV